MVISPHSSPLRGRLFPANIRIGDYSATALDPSDHQTFFSANEYIASDGFTNISVPHISTDHHDVIKSICRKLAFAAKRA